MKFPKTLLAGLFTGFLLGGGAYHLTSDEVAPPPIDDPNDPPALSPMNSRSEIRSSPTRPSFEQVCEATGVDATGIVARFLAEASIEEITQLMDRVLQRKTQIGHLMWMIQARGLKVNPQATLAWTKSNQPDELRSLYQRWIVSDPHAALRSSLHEPLHIRLQMLQAMKGADPKEVIAAAEDLPLSGEMLKAIEEMQWAHLAQNDVQEALAKGLAISDAAKRKQALQTIIESWASKDALAALRWIETQDELEGANGLLEIGIEKLAKTHPHLAQKKLEALPPTRNREILEGKVADQWAALDPEAALDWIKNLPQGADRDHLFASMIDELDQDPKELMELIRELGVNVNFGDRLSRFDINSDSSRISYYESPESLREKYDIMLSELARDSPKEALEAMYRSGDLELTEFDRIFRNSASPQQIAQRWAEEDPKAAADWVLSLPESAVRSQTKDSVFRTWAEASPEMLASFLAEDVGDDRADLSGILASEWARQDLDATFAWVDQLQGETKESALSSTLSTVAENDPQFALQHLDRLEDPQAQDAVLAAATSTWREQDPAGVMSWFQIQPPEAEIDKIVSATAKDWVLSHPHDASQWISAMDEGPRRDQAVAGIIEALTTTGNPNADIHAARVWLETIADPELKEGWRTNLESRSKRFE